MNTNIWNKIIVIMMECEGGPQAETPQEIPAIEVLRARYKKAPHAKESVHPAPVQ